MPDFLEEQFPPAIAYGASGGPKFKTTIVATANGFEFANVDWAKRRGEWDVGHGIKTLAEYQSLLAFFHVVQGMATPFRFKDWLDYTGTDETIGTGDGSETVFQLIKTYTFGSASYVRDIKKPVSGTVTIYIDDVEQGAGWSVDTTTGEITFSAAPSGGEVITADYEFDVPARFDTDQMDAAIEDFNLYSWGNIPVVEIRI